MFEANVKIPIMVVEDSDEDFDVLRMTFDQHEVHNPCFRAREGREVFALLNDARARDEDLPGLIILDLNLIGIDGREVLRRLKRDPLYSRIPVIVFSTSSSPKDIEACFAEGAASYSVKPVSLEKLESFVAAFKNFWLCNSVLPRRSPLERMRRTDGP